MERVFDVINWDVWKCVIYIPILPSHSFSPSFSLPFLSTRLSFLTRVSYLHNIIQLYVTITCTCLSMKWPNSTITITGDYSLVTRVICIDQFQDFKCEQGETCIAMVVHCIRAPCPPIPASVCVSTANILHSINVLTDFVLIVFARTSGQFWFKFNKCLIHMFMYI